jgi:hypothetical protein
MHGGLSTGVRTEAGKAAIKEHAREQMLARWECYRAENGGRVPLTEASRERVRQTARRTMRLRHRKREALEWAERMLEQNRNVEIRLWRDRCQRVILKPYLTAIDCGGLEKLYELSNLAGIDLRSHVEGADLTAAILRRYAPRFNIQEAAEDLRRGGQEQ